MMVSCVMDIFALAVWGLIVFVVFGLAFLIIINSRKDD